MARPLGLSKVGKVDETNYEPEEMKWNLKSLRAMKKTIVTMAAFDADGWRRIRMRTAAREEGRLRGDRSYGSRNGVPGYR